MHKMCIGYNIFCHFCSQLTQIRGGGPNFFRVVGKMLKTVELKVK